MKVKIWGARGSIPAPIRPEEVREKVISALLSISEVEDSQFREQLLSAILPDSHFASQTADHSPEPEGTAGAGRVGQADPEAAEAKRRGVVEAYLNSLSPLSAETVSGNTPCVEVRSGNDLFILDAGSGIRELGLELMHGDCGLGRGIIHLLFSHPHWDHIQGFPFFRPAFVPGNKIYIYSVHDMESVLRRQQEFINFPVSLDYMQAHMTFIRIKPEEVLEFGDLRVRNIRNHHPGDSYAFRFEKGNKVFVYSTDASYPAGTDLRPYINFFSEADVLIYDSQFTQRESDEKEDWGHGSSFGGVEMAQQAKVKCLVLFHYDPTAFDKELEKILEDTLKFQQSQYPGQEPVKVMLVREGQTFDLMPARTTQLQQVPGGKALILKPVGVFDEHVAAELRDQLLNQRKNQWPIELIINMSGVDMMQVAGLRALVKLRKEQKGASVALAGPSISVQELIELAGYMDFFAVYPSVHAALNAFQARETLNLPGQMIDNRYYIESKIGDGHLGTVFKATDTRLNRPVAVKVLSPAFSEGALEQFLNQARQIVELQHPNIVTVYDCDEDRGLSFVVEEYLECKTLLDLMVEDQDQPLPFNLALSITESVARALEYAHAHGVVHGDLKPENILLGAEVRVSDFGLGRLESGKPLDPERLGASAASRYLAPEQVLGHPIDARTDLYALGVILYELFTGRPPFYDRDGESEHPRPTLPPSPRKLNPALARSLEHLILKLLDKDPNQRYASARQVQRILASMTLVTSGETQYRSPLRQRWPTLIGQSEALQRLIKLWEETRLGQGQLVFITGEVGLGKTRLLQELADFVSDATLLIGNCEKLEGSAAYQPFVEAVHTYFASLPADTAARNPVKQVLSEIGRFVPELHRFIPGLGPTQPSQSSALPPVSLAMSIAGAASERPWLLILDNLQWADQGSLQLLHYLARHCGGMPLMVVGAYRPSALDNNRYLIEVLDSLDQHIAYSAISLECLSESQVKKLLDSIWNQTVPADLVTAVYNRTGGNAFYVEEIARGLVDEGVVSWRDDRWHFAPIIGAGLPQRTRDAILRRVNRLNKETQTLLHRAAVLGHTFRFADLHEISGQTEWNVLENLDLALERHFVMGAPGDDMLRFSHAEIQEVLYDNLSPLKRRLLHREAGEALERRYLPEPERIAASLAHHFFQAGELEKGLIYSIQAAKQADQLYASQDALIWYTQALDALDQLGMDDMTQQQRFELLLAREQIYDHLGERQLQAVDLAALQSLAQSFNDPIRQSVVHNRQARYERLTNQLGGAATEAQAGVIAAQQAGHAVLEGESLLQSGWIALNRGQPEAAMEHMQAAWESLKKSDHQRSEARSLVGLGAIYKSLGDYDRAEVHYQQALSINQLINERQGQAACLHNLGLVHLEMGRYAKARSYIYQSLEINRARGDRRGEAICLSALALISKEWGDYALAQSFVKAAIPIRRMILDHRGHAKDLTTLGATYLAQGNYAAARDHTQQALELFQHIQAPAEEGRTWLELGLAQEALGDLANAANAYRQARTLRGQVGHEPSVLDARAGLARCLLAAGKTEAARADIEACLAWLSSHGTSGVIYPVRFFLTAFWVLQAANKGEEAAVALHQGHVLLQKRAYHIGQQESKAQFLRNVPENKELSIQFAKYHQAEGS